MIPGIMQSCLRTKGLSECEEKNVVSHNDTYGVVIASNCQKASVCELVKALANPEAKNVANGTSCYNCW